jgi:glucose/arabinose dehydrogenase
MEPSIPMTGLTRKMVILLLAAVCFALWAGASSQAATLPPFFNDSLVVGGLSSPRSLDFFPDGRILVVENGGTFLLVNGSTSTNLGTLAGVSTSGEQGLLGVAIDPDFPARPFVYVHYTTVTNVQVARLNFTNASGPGPLGIDLASRLILLADMPNVNTNHNGGTVRFGPDKTLYISIGDDATGGCDAQNVSWMAGKILRIKVDASINPANRSTLAPSDNPFSGDPRVNATLVWAYGLRNPFRFDIDPVTGTLFIGDVGQSAWEEIDVVTAGGANLGWPYWEGNATYRTSLCPTDSSFPTVQFPVYTFVNTGSAVIMGALYRGVDYPNDSSFPPEFDENAFFFDFYKDVMHVLRSPNNGTNWTLVPGLTSTDFATGMLYTTDMREGPDGALYWLAESTSELRRIGYNPVPQVTTASLPPGTVGTAYAALAQASGRPTPFNWSVASGALPAGLTIDNATGAISGAPTAVGTASFVLQVNTSAGRSGTRPFTIRVADPVTLAPASLTAAIQNQPYTQPLAALGGAGPFVWTINSGALPPGFTLSTSSGHITGTCSAVGNWTFVVDATDADARSGQLAYTLQVIEELRLVTAALPDGNQSQWYAFSLAAAGGVAPYTWAANASTPLPPGLSLGSSNGTLYGMPTGASATRLDFDIQDSAGQFVTAGLDLVIAPPPGSPPIVANTGLPDAVVDAPYNVTLAEAGGTAPFVWAADNASMPPGVTLSPSGPWVAGTPTSIGNWTFSVTVTDRFARTGSRNLTLSVVPVTRSITILTAGLPPGEIGVAYAPVDLLYEGVNLSSQIRWDAIGLPAGLSLQGVQNRISGTPTESGTFDVAVRVYDNQSAGVEAAATFTLVIDRVTVITQTLPGFTLGVGITLTLVAGNSSQHPTWHLVSGALPAGVVLDPGGTIHGTPTQAGNFTFIVRAENPAAPSENFQEQSFTIHVSDSAAPPRNPPAEPQVASDFAFILAALVAGGIVLLAILSSRRRHKE